MNSNVGSERKNVESNFLNNNLSNNSSSIEDSINLQGQNNQDNFFTENINISDSEGDISFESNFSENSIHQLDSTEKTKIYVPLSIETKDGNAFFLNRSKSLKDSKNQAKISFKQSVDHIQSSEKKKLKNNRKYRIKKDAINIEFEEKEKKHNKKSSFCCCLQTEESKKNTNSTEDQSPKLSDFTEVKIRNAKVEEPTKQKFLEDKPKNSKNTEHKINKIQLKKEIDKNPQFIETKLNIVNEKSPKSKSFENIYKIFEYKMNIEIPKFNDSMDLGFLSKKFEEKETNQNKPSTVKFSNFYEKTITEIISDTLSWYEIYKLNRVKKLEGILDS
ncbi:hypothetical protein CmeUKMEL1_08750 [Cryptosporidium meleagridis]|uniref:Uncharacterized protein n=1 Tax=Cryptosporidium meleagridis TaxID=93969 RepID=A0A2P4Z116_9CRYT|nr:hypothetical protein CmeUKMEL1_08750 [Cryptosporidium meleagridis]